MDDTVPTEYCERLLELAGDSGSFRRMNDPVAAAFVKGQCGDEMEFYLTIRRGRIEDISYYSDGCEVTRACGALVCRKAQGLQWHEALGINARDIAAELEPLPDSHRHCPILAVITLYKAVADYLLKP